MSPLPRVNDALLQPWLALLCLVSAVAVLQAALFPSWPRAPELDGASLQQALRQAGLEPQPLPARPPQRSRERALSRQLGWRLAGGAQLWLLQGAVGRYETLQAAMLARGNPQLLLRDRRLETPQPGSAAGFIAGRPAVQTCLVPQSDGPALAGVTRQALLRASDPRRQLRALGDPATWRDPDALGASLSALLGPRRFSCVLVSLRSDTARPLPPDLWPRLLPALQVALQPHPPQSPRSQAQAAPPLRL